MLLVQCVMMGGVVFVADVVLVVLYLDAVESGRLKLGGAAKRPAQAHRQLRSR